MKIVIVGGGKVGFTLAARLAKEEHDIVLIDNDRSVIKAMDEALDVLVIYGNGAALDVQRSAGVESADLMIAVTSGDELNLMCCILAKKLGCKNTIARMRNPEYSEQLYFLRDELGLTMTVNPEWSAAQEIFRLMQIPGFLKRDSFAKGRIEIVEIILKEDSKLCGVQLSELGKKLNMRVLVCAVERKGQVYIPGGNFTLLQGDKIYVNAPTSELAELMQSLGIRSKKSKNAMIIGGGRITQYLAALLLETGTRVKIIELDRARCEWLAERFPSAEIINSDGSSQNILMRENIEQMDTVVSLTGIDEENLIISMFANHVGVNQVIAKLNRTEYTDIFTVSGVDCIISPKLLCAQNIIRYVRSKQNTENGGGSVLSLHHLIEGRMEALEFIANETTENLGRTLSEIKLKPNLLISSINRRGKVIIPGGSDTLENGDTVVVVTTSDRIIYDLNDIFAEDER